MAKKRSYKRDNKGRFASGGGGGGGGPVNGYRKARVRGLRASVQRRNAGERSYVAATGDRGTATDRRRFAAKNRRLEAKAKRFEGKIKRSLAKKR